MPPLARLSSASLQLNASLTHPSSSNCTRTCPITHAQTQLQPPYPPPPHPPLSHLQVNDAGRAFLSGYQIPLESIALVSIDDGTISIVEQGERTALSGADISSVDVRGLSNFDLVDGDDGDDDDWYSRGVSAQRV